MLRVVLVLVALHLCLSAALAPPKGYSKKHLLLDEKFSTLANWNPYITSKAANGWPWNAKTQTGCSGGGQYDAEVFCPSQVAVGHSGLQIHAIRATTTGEVNGDTTATWKSGVVCSYGKKEFQGGYIQLRAKLPAGDGFWAGFWLLPGATSGATTDDFEIDIFEQGFFLTDGKKGTPARNYAWHLHHGYTTVDGNVKALNVDLTAGYHDYAVEWVPGKRVTWYLDGKLVGQITSAKFAIPNEPMELILSLGVSNSKASSWRTVYGPHLQRGTLSISELQVYALHTGVSGVTHALAANSTNAVAATSSSNSLSGTEIGVVVVVVVCALVVLALLLVVAVLVLRGQK